MDQQSLLENCMSLKTLLKIGRFLLESLISHLPFISSQFHFSLLYLIPQNYIEFKFFIVNFLEFLSWLLTSITVAAASFTVSMATLGYTITHTKGRSLRTSKEVSNRTLEMIMCELPFQCELLLENHGDVVRNGVGGMTDCCACWSDSA
jgi:hypothetical protein